MPKQKQLKKKIVLGLTGSFGSGKSSVAKMLRSYGAKIIDADKLAHDCLKPQSPAYRKIIKCFGTADRKKLAEIVFSNKKALKKLEGIIHPEVIRNIKRRVLSLKPQIVVVDAPLLIEAGLKNLADYIIVVKINRSEQLKRIEKKTGLKKEQILKRIKFQIPLRRKARLADFIIDNSGTMANTKRQVALIRRKLWKN